VETLQGNGPADFYEICEEFATAMLVLGGKGTPEECKGMVKKAVQTGSGLETFAHMVREQGGDETYLYHTEKFETARYRSDFLARESGYIGSMDTELCGKTAVILGAGRETKDSEIDMTAGICFYKKTGSTVEKGEVLATLYSNDKEKIKTAEEYLQRAYTFSEKKPKLLKNIIAYVTKNGVEML
jgi:pyrimidine-nucleoside phosphorylase